MFSSSSDEVTPCGKSEYGQRSMGRSGKNESTSYDPLSVSSSSSNRSDGASSSQRPLQQRTISGHWMVSLNFFIRSQTFVTNHFTITTMDFFPRILANTILVTRLHYRNCFCCWWCCCITNHQHTSFNDQFNTLIVHSYIRLCGENLGSVSPRNNALAVKVELMLWISGLSGHYVNNNILKNLKGNKCLIFFYHRPA